MASDDEGKKVHEMIPRFKDHDEYKDHVKEKFDIDLLTPEEALKEYVHLEEHPRIISGKKGYLKRRLDTVIDTFFNKPKDEGGHLELKIEGESLVYKLRDNEADARTDAAELLRRLGLYVVAEGNEKKMKDIDSAKLSPDQLRMQLDGYIRLAAQYAQVQGVSNYDDLLKELLANRGNLDNAKVYQTLLRVLPELLASKRKSSLEQKIKNSESALSQTFQDITNAAGKENKIEMNALPYDQLWEDFKRVVKKEYGSEEHIKARLGDLKHPGNYQY